MMALHHLSDQQLKKLFQSTHVNLTEQEKVILTELMRRGYFFDVRQGKFLSFRQWNQHYGEMSPTDYFAYFRT
jgi:hypothetical protein